MNRLRSGILLFPLLALFIFSPVLAGDADVVKVNAKGSASEILDRLKKLIADKRFKVFTVYDHGDANSLKHVIAFGKANHSARIMWHDPAAGLELPLKIAVLQDDVGTQVVYRKPTSWRDSYKLQDCNLLDELDGVMAELAQKAAQ